MAIGTDAGGKNKRRTRNWSTPHAEFAISPRGVHQLHRRKSAENYAGINNTTRVTCTFFARCWKIPLRKPPVVLRNAI